MNETVLASRHIPFQLVGDEEMAAIEEAFSGVQSVAPLLFPAHSLQPTVLHSSVPLQCVTSQSPTKRGPVQSYNFRLQKCLKGQSHNHCSHNVVRDSTDGDFLVVPFCAEREADSVPPLQSEAQACVGKVDISEARSTEGAIVSRNLKPDSQITPSISDSRIVEEVFSAVRPDAEVSPQRNTLIVAAAHDVYEKTAVLVEGNAPIIIESDPGTSNLSQEQSREFNAGRIGDIEDLQVSKQATQEENHGRGEEGVGPMPPSLRYGSRGLSVTDFTALEWCEKQVEFSMTLGKPKRTSAMKAGSVRHIELEVEVVTRVEVAVHSKEDSWAIRLLNFITGARQLQSEGLTRELPVLGIIDGMWVLGVIDELQLCEREGGERPLLVDTKTRSRPSPPSEAQKRNGRLQLMVYKLLWDSMVTVGIPFTSFFHHFRLRPEHSLNQDVMSHAADIYLGVEVKNLQDLVCVFSEECLLFPQSHDSLLLRYELQADRALLGQDEFPFEGEWLEARLRWHLEYLQGRRHAAFVPEDELWKCRFCSFADVCPAAQANHCQ